MLANDKSPYISGQVHCSSNECFSLYLYVYSNFSKQYYRLFQHVSQQKCEPMGESIAHLGTVKQHNFSEKVYRVLPHAPSPKNLRCLIGRLEEADIVG